MIYKAFALAIGLLMTSELAVAQNGSDEDAFRIGGSCAALAYTSVDTLKKTVASAFSEELHAFCYAEEPFDCTDYTGFLKGLGTMVTSEDGYYCRLKAAE